MRKVYLKLIAIALTLVLSAGVMVVSSYAWFVLSESPAVSGIQVTIGGGNTILIAPDVTKTVDGVTYHYPGYFNDTMNFAQHESYRYLLESGGLVPVSTADGVHWFLPTYYDLSDKEVQTGQVFTGQLKPYDSFILDDELEYANLAPDDAEKLEKGSYAYLDFWVVSPGSNYTLRVSTGDDSGGSFLVDLLQPAKSDETASGYTLTPPQNTGAAAIRVGFLANPIRLTDDSMLHYQESHAFDSRYTSLQGLYSEPDSGNPDLPANRFIIYEPNGDSHPYDEQLDGSYVFTSPVALVGGTAKAISVQDRLTVQQTSDWGAAANGQGTAIEQRFQTALLGRTDLTDMTAAQITAMFYGQYLQGQISPYVQKGSFFTNTADLYKHTGSISAEALAQIPASGATEDVSIIELYRNVPQRIRMFIWIEGQDVDCVNAVATSSVALNLEFAGSNDELS